MFFKLTVRQQVEGTPGFVDDEIFEVQVNSEHITLFNKSVDDPEITFVRLSCGATLMADMKYNDFVKLMSKVSGEKITR